jgi:polysaccharide pyruvyl transferase WcaK-like protein
MKRPQVLICGYYGYGNAGDEALLLALLQQLRQLPNPIQPVVLSPSPAGNRCHLWGAGLSTL